MNTLLGNYILGIMIQKKSSAYIMSNEIDQSIESIEITITRRVLKLRFQGEPELSKMKIISMMSSLYLHHKLLL